MVDLSINGAYGVYNPFFFTNLADPVISPNRSFGVTVEGVYEWAAWNI